MTGSFTDPLCSAPHGRPDHPHLALSGIDELSAAAFHAFHRALRLHRRVLMQSFAQHGIHHGQAMCLRLLAGEGEVTQRDLAGELHVSSPTVTRMVRSMEQTGLVRRHPDPGDARLVRVELTDAGRAQALQMRDAASGYIADTFATLTEDERRELARLLDKLGDRIAEVAAAQRGAAGAAGGAPAAGAEPPQAELGALEAPL